MYPNQQNNNNDSWDPVSKKFPGGGGSGDHFNNNNNISPSVKKYDDTHVVYIDPLPHPNDVPNLGLPDMINDMLWDKNRFMVRVFDLMTIALGITASTAYVLSESSALPWLLQHPSFVIALLVVKLLVVNFLAATAPRMSPLVATSTFFAYAVMNGIVLAPIFQIYTHGSIVSAFTSATAVFLTMSCYGYATKRDLTSVGSLLGMSLYGIIVALVINIFWRNPIYDMLLSIVVILVFTGLVAWDAQKIKKIGEALGHAGGEQAFTGLAVIGALELYLDFLNLFLYILKLFGKKKFSPKFSVSS